MTKFLDLEGLNYFWDKIKTWVQERFASKYELSQKLNVLISGQNIKRINNQDILGYGNIDIQSSTGAVNSVNGKTGDVVLSAGDVGALPNDTFIPTVPEISISISADAESNTKTASPKAVKEYVDAHSGGGGSSITIDDELSDSSTNPVQNKVIKEALDEKANTSDIPNAVSGTNDGTNWTSITIGDITKAIPSGGSGGGGTITDVQLNGNSVVTGTIANLPAYPTTLPASDVYSWAKQSSKPSYDYSEIGSTPDLSGYVTTSALNTALAGYVSSSDLSTALASYTPTSQLSANYIQKSQTVGLLKNDGTVDTNTYLTQHQSLSGYAKYEVVNALPANPESDTLYLIPES